MYAFDKYSLALDYHENSKLFNQEYRPYNQRISYKIYPSAKSISLDKNSLNAAQHDNDSFLQTLLSRQSIRSFTPENIDLSTLSRLLTLSCGLRDDRFRTYASAGARYPIEVYIVILRSDDLDKGIYHYNIIDNTLELIKTGDYTQEMNDFYQNQVNAKVLMTDFPCLIFFSMVFERTMQKYGERGYRFALIDAGHMSQNLYLTATYLKLGLVALGGGAVSDNMLDDILGLLHCEENVFYGFAVGHPTV